MLVIAAIFILQVPMDAIFDWALLVKSYVLYHWKYFGRWSTSGKIHCCSRFSLFGDNGHCGVPRHPKP